MSVNIRENICEETLHNVEKKLLSRRVPIKLFKELITASKDLDFTKVNDPVIKSRYLESRNKIEPYFRSVIYQSVYTSDDEDNTRYEELINVLIDLFSIFDTIIEGRLYITDIAQQETSVINDFLDSYGFLIHRIFETPIKIELAQHIYRNIRLKGTTELLTILLSHIGFNSYQIDEYELNSLDGEFVLAPHTTYRSHGISGQTVDVYPIKVEDLDDILWTVTDEELRRIFNRSLLTLVQEEDTTPEEDENP
jgi:hypothetical protein